MKNRVKSTTMTVEPKPKTPEELAARLHKLSEIMKGYEFEATQIKEALKRVVRPDTKRIFGRFEVTSVHYRACHKEYWQDAFDQIRVKKLPKTVKLVLLPPVPAS